MEFLSNDRTWFTLDQANIWYRKLGEGRGGPEVETEDCFEKTFFFKFSNGSDPQKESKKAMDNMKSPNISGG